MDKFVEKLINDLDKSTFLNLVSRIRAWENGSTDHAFHKLIEEKFASRYPREKEAFDKCEKNGLGYPVE